MREAAGEKRRGKGWRMKGRRQRRRKNGGAVSGGMVLCCRDVLTSHKEMQSGKTLAKQIQHQIHRHHLDAIGDSRFSYLFLQACKDANSIHQLHSLLHKTGLAAGSDFYRTKLVALYGSMGKMKSAWKMFDEKHQRNVYLCNAMLRSYWKEKLWNETLNLFWEMKRLGIETDNYTVPLALKACGGLSALKIAMQIHGSIVGTVMEWKENNPPNPLSNQQPTKEECFERSRRRVQKERVNEIERKMGLGHMNKKRRKGGSRWVERRFFFSFFLTTKRINFFL